MSAKPEANIALERKIKYLAIKCLSKTDIPIISGSSDPCLICCGKIPDFNKEDNSLQSSATVASSSSTLSILDRHLEIIFLLRNVLEVPGSQLAGFLESCHNVEGWIKICDSCGAMINECKVVYQQLLEVKRKWMECKLKVVEVMKNVEETDCWKQSGVVVDIFQDTRRFAKTHQYGSFMDPFILGDRKAFQLATQLNNPEIKIEVEENTELETITDFCDGDPVGQNMDCEDNIEDNLNDKTYQPEVKAKSKRCLKNPKSPKSKKKKNRKPGVPVDCHLCQMTLSDIYRLRRHLQVIHSVGTSEFRCEICKKIFGSKWDLQVHARNCGKSGPFGTGSSSTEYLQLLGDHFRLKCPIEGCSQRWSNYAPYRTHMKADHSKEERASLPKWVKILECVTCGQLQGCKEYARAHMFTHDKTLKKEVVCEVCGKEFATKSTLRSHQSRTLRCRKLTGISESEAQAVCDICGNRYSNKHVLQKHVKEKHQGSPYHKCQQCGVTLGSKIQLIVHLAKVHQIGDAKEVEHTCPMEGCGKTFYYKKNLKDHIKGVHRNGEPGYKCQEEGCGKAFYTNRYLGQHIRVVHRGIKHNYKKKANGESRRGILSSFKKLV